MRLFRTAMMTLLLAAFFVPGYIARADGDHLITMQQADIRAFIDDVAIVTGKTIIVDPRVNGQVTISSEQSLNPDEVWAVFKDVMRVHSYTVIPTNNGEYRVTLLQGSAADAPLVQRTGVSGQMGTIVLRLENVTADDAGKLIRPVMNPAGIVSAVSNGNVLVVSDYPENLYKAREIISTLDVDSRQAQTFRLTHIQANDAAEALKSMGGPRPDFVVIPVEANNSLIIEGEARALTRLSPIVAQLDQPGTIQRGKLSLVKLRFADGGLVVEALTPLLGSFAADGKPEPSLSYDAVNNSVIINADPETQAALEQIIRQLDTRRPQVLVEAIIVEISDTAARDLGVQFALGGNEGSSIPFVGTNFAGQGPDMFALAGAVATDSTSTSPNLRASALSSLLGLDGGVLGGVGLNDDAIFAVILNAVERDTDSNILSTPYVMTLDNSPAIFLVGQDIPITTGETLGTANLNPFRTFERQEIGTKLEVLPQISEGDVIRLQIKQEVSSLSNAIAPSTQELIINKREIETTVYADNGEIIVLGGLIGDDEQITLDKVPLLGDLPGIGRLFQSEGKTRTKTNLVVFLRPTIVRSAEDARPITQGRINRARVLDQEQSGRPTSKIDDYLVPQ